MAYDGAHGEPGVMSRWIGERTVYDHQALKELLACLYDVRHQGILR